MVVTLPPFRRKFTNFSWTNNISSLYFLSLFKKVGKNVAAVSTSWNQEPVLLILKMLICSGTSICHPAHRGHFPTLHRTPLSSRKLHWFVKCFIILKHFEDNYICSPAAVAAVSLLGIKTSPADSFYAATISSPNLWIWLMISCSRSFDGFLKPLM